jgi:DNA-nicking Smr family endonuclease
MSHKKPHPVPDDLPPLFVVTDTLDLHGFFPEQIPEILDAFLENALETGLSRLRVVHGKGKSRLKFEVVRVLRADSRVAAFGDAPPELGGWGATCIELKQPKGTGPN